MPLTVDGTVTGALAGMQTLNGNIASELSVSGALTTASGQGGGGIPRGGNPGQYLAKRSDTDYDTEWTDGSGGIFFAQYNVTTSAEIDAALEAGMLVVAIRDGKEYSYYGQTVQGKHVFSVVTEQNSFSVYCQDDRWSNSYAALALTATVNSKASKDSIAKQFLSSQNYVAGEYVWYNEELYRFVVDHPSGSWDSAQAVKVKLSEDLRGIPSGGSSGDIMMKRSGADYDAEWVPPANSAEQDNTRPITAAAVYTEIGNINALLATI